MMRSIVPVLLLFLSTELLAQKKPAPASVFGRKEAFVLVRAVSRSATLAEQKATAAAAGSAARAAAPYRYIIRRSGGSSAYYDSAQVALTGFEKRALSRSTGEEGGAVVDLLCAVPVAPVKITPGARVFTATFSRRAVLDDEALVQRWIVTRLNDPADGRLKDRERGRLLVRFGWPPVKKGDPFRLPAVPAGDSVTVYVACFPDRP